MKSILGPLIKGALCGTIAVVSGGTAVPLMAGAFAAYNGIKAVGNAGREIIGEDEDEVFLSYFNFDEGETTEKRIGGAFLNSVPDNPITDLIGYKAGMKASHCVLRIRERGSSDDLCFEISSERIDGWLKRRYGIAISGLASNSFGDGYVYLNCFKRSNSNMRDSALSKTSWGKKKSHLTIEMIKAKAIEIFDSFGDYDGIKNNCQDFARKLASELVN